MDSLGLFLPLLTVFFRQDKLWLSIIFGTWLVSPPTDVLSLDLRGIPSCSLCYAQKHSKHTILTLVTHQRRDKDILLPLSLHQKLLSPPPSASVSLFYPREVFQFLFRYVCDISSRFFSFHVLIDILLVSVLSPSCVQPVFMVLFAKSWGFKW